MIWPDEVASREYPLPARLLSSYPSLHPLHLTRPAQTLASGQTLFADQLQQFFCLPEPASLHPPAPVRHIWITSAQTGLDPAIGQSPVSAWIDMFRNQGDDMLWQHLRLPLLAALVAITATPASRAGDCC